MRLGVLLDLLACIQFVIFVNGERSVSLAEVGLLAAHWGSGLMA